MKAIQEKLERGRAWWGGLLPRERKMLAGGALCLALIFLWFGLLTPWLAWQQKLAADLSRLRADLAQMQGLARQAKALPTRTAAPDAAALATELQNDLVRQRLAAPGQGLRQEGGGRLAISLKAADFDTLLAWLEQAQNRHGLRVASAKLVRIEGQAGAVKADLVLESGGNP